tara:strand:+ start:1850 stop:2008 length:159 start_codon:yes stop_codon:yes gene_type:complete
VNLNIEHHKRILVKAAIKKHRFKKDAAQALGISVKYLTTIQKEFSNKGGSSI